MYHPTTRVLTVLELLQSHQRLSGPDLARRLEVNVRTARRYITMLQDMGIPIEAERGRHGAYRLRAGFKLPPLMFNEDEALAVILGLQAARELGLAATAPAVEGALAKIACKRCNSRSASIWGACKHPWQARSWASSAQLPGEGNGCIFGIARRVATKPSAWSIRMGWCITPGAGMPFAIATCAQGCACFGSTGYKA
jgi:biotin operon repressor